jgi:hypothetical protein
LALLVYPAAWVNLGLFMILLLSAEAARGAWRSAGALALGGLAAALLALKGRHANLRSTRAYLSRFDEARAGGVGRCRSARAFVNVDHRGRVSKCVEFQAPEDRAGDLTREDVHAIGPRLRAIEAGNACRSCWSASRGEIESLFTARGLIQALPDLVRS